MRRTLALSLLGLLPLATGCDNPKPASADAPAPAESTAKVDTPPVPPTARGDESQAQAETDAPRAAIQVATAPKRTRVRKVDEAKTKAIVSAHLQPGQLQAHPLFEGPIGPGGAQGTLVTYEQEGRAKGFVLVDVPEAEVRRIDLPAFEDYALFKVRAVLFVDVEGDGQSELVVMCAYMTGIGPEGAKPFNQNHVFRWRTGKLERDPKLEQEVESLATGKQVRQVLMDQRSEPKSPEGAPLPHLPAPDAPANTRGQPPKSTLALPGEGKELWRATIGDASSRTYGVGLRLQDKGFALFAHQGFSPELIKLDAKGQELERLKVPALEDFYGLSILADGAWASAGNVLSDEREEDIEGPAGEIYEGAIGVSNPDASQRFRTVVADTSNGGTLRQAPDGSLWALMSLQSYSRSLLVHLDATGAVLDEHILDGMSIRLGGELLFEDGHIYVVGSKELMNERAADIAIEKLTLAAKPVWSKTFGEAEVESLLEQAILDDGRIYTLARHTKQDDELLSETELRAFSLEGEQLWVQTIPAQGASYPHTLTALGRGGHLLVSVLFSASGKGYSCALLPVDVDGSLGTVTELGEFCPDQDVRVKPGEVVFLNNTSGPNGSVELRALAW